METAIPLSETARKLSDEELGKLQRKANEIARRIEIGNIELPWILSQMQRLIEGKKDPDKVYLFRAQPQEFVRPPAEEQKRSITPISKRLPEFLQRLEFPTRNWEHLITEMWEAENIPSFGVNGGSCAAWAIMGNTEITDRDLEVMSSTIQWLGTNIGSDFLRRFVKASQIIL